MSLIRSPSGPGVACIPSSDLVLRMLRGAWTNGFSGSRSRKSSQPFSFSSLSLALARFPI